MGILLSFGSFTFVSEMGETKPIGRGLFVRWGIDMMMRFRLLDSNVGKIGTTTMRSGGDVTTKSGVNNDKYMHNHYFRGSA